MKINKFLTELSVTSSGDNIYHPRMLSALSDTIYFFNLGFIKAKRKR